MEAARRGAGIVLAASLMAAPPAAAAGSKPARATDADQGVVRQSRLPEIGGLWARPRCWSSRWGRGAAPGALGGVPQWRVARLRAQRSASAGALWRLAPWLVVAVFAAVEVALIMASRAGPTIDEGRLHRQPVSGRSEATGSVTATSPGSPARWCGRR